MSSLRLSHALVTLLGALLWWLAYLIGRHGTIFGPGRLITRWLEVGANIVFCSRPGTQVLVAVALNLAYMVREGRAEKPAYCPAPLLFRLPY